MLDTPVQMLYNQITNIIFNEKARTIMKRGALYTRLNLTAVISVFLTVLFLFLPGCGSSSPDAAVCEIVVKDYGIITVTLDGISAPTTVSHFIKLAESGAYDGSYFNRVQAGFVLQGGAGAKDTSTIKGEFASNGVSNDIKHEKGVISMARATDPNSASSQFFIMLETDSTLDGNYAAFGRVTDGWDTVEKICSSVSPADYTEDYYGQAMGFLKSSSYILIETVRVVSK